MYKSYFYFYLFPEVSFYNVEYIPSQASGANASPLIPPHHHPFYTPRVPSLSNK